MKRHPSKKHHPSLGRRHGFTLIEVILVLVVILIVAGVSVPYLAGSYRGTRLRTASRTIERMCRYAHSMAIMREETLTLVLDESKMEVSIGSEQSQSTNSVDGQLDMKVLKNLNYIDNDGPNLDKEVTKLLPEGLSVRDFEKYDTADENYGQNFHVIHFYPNGQCDEFRLELEDNKGMELKMENDPISGKVWSEFLQ